MIPNVTRGDDSAGLLRYLFGPGEANEHTNQRLITSSADIAAIGAPHFEEVGELEQLAKEFDAPKNLFGTEVKHGHVWHCSLSIPPEDGRLTDEQWSQVAREFMDGMWFSDATGKAPCRWLAVHHGLSVNGNDHIHVMVDLVRTDGTRADTYLDYSRSQRACADIERRMGLRVVEGRQSGRSMPGTKRGERESALSRGQAEPNRLTLARRVRAAAVVSASETEFVQNLRASGVIARPRYGSGGRHEVVGYSVALHTGDGTKPIWFGGGKLARDLTLSRLREQWPESDPGEAVEAWSGRRGEPRRMTNPMLRDETAWEMAAQQVQQVRERLAAVPADDVAQWAQAAHEASGILAVLSARMEAGRPGALARASDVLARSAQRTTDYRSRALSARPGQLRGAAMAAFHSRSSGAGEALFLLSLRNMMRGLHVMHQAREERDQARQLEVSARGDLLRLQQMREHLSTVSPGALPAPGPGLGQAPYGPGRNDRGYGR